MNRLSALCLGGLWLLFLLIFDLGWVLRPASLRPQATRILSELFVSEVSFADVSAAWNGDVRFTDVRVSYPGRPQDEYLRAAELSIGLDFGALASGRSPVREVRILHPEAVLTWLPGGGFDLPSPIRSDAQSTKVDGLPRLAIDGLALRFRNAPWLAETDTTIRLQGFRVDLVPDARKGSGHYDFEASANDPIAGAFAAHGSIEGEDFEVHIRRGGFKTTERLRALLTPGIADLLAKLEVSGGVELLGTVAKDPRSGRATYRARMNLDGARLAFGGWPQALTDVRGIMRYADGILTTDGTLRGMLEDARLELSARADLTGRVPLVEAQGNLKGLVLNDAFVDRLGALPDPGPEIRRQLREWRLRGPADVDFRLGPRPDFLLSHEFSILPEIQVDLQGCELVYQGEVDPETGQATGFPYPLRDVYGLVRLNDETMSFEPLVARQEGMQLRAWGKVDYSRKGRETYSAHVWARGVPIDDRLLSALDEGTREGVRSLRAQGLVDVTVQVERTESALDRPTTKVGLTLLGLRVHPVSFPFALENLRGTIDAENDVVRLESVTASHGAAHFTLSGTAGMEARAGELDLLVNARGLELGEDLWSAVGSLDEDAAAKLREWKLGGSARLDVRLTSHAGQATPYCQGTINVEKVSLTPPDLGVRVHDIEGGIELWITPQVRSFEIFPGFRGRIGEAELVVERASATLGSKIEAVIKAPSFRLDDAFLTECAGLWPALRDPATRPRIDGVVRDFQIQLKSMRGAPLETKLTGEFRDLSFAWPTWKSTGLEQLSGRVTFNQDSIFIEKIQGRLRRPADLPPIPRELMPSSTVLYGLGSGIELEIESCGVRRSDDQPGLAISGLRLRSVPIEPWLLELFGIPPEERRRYWLPSLTGFMDITVEGAKIKRNQVMLTDGRLQLRSLQIGRHEEIFLEEGVLDDWYFALMPDGAASFRGALSARNFRLLGMPIPRLEGSIAGDEHGFGIGEIGGVLLGYENERFDPRLAGRPQLLARMQTRWPTIREDWDSLSDGELRALVERVEFFDVDRSPRAELLNFVPSLGLASRRRAETLDTSELRKLVREGRDVRPLGVLASEGTRLSIDWNRGRLAVDGLLDQVNLAAAAHHFGATTSSLQGRLKARLGFEGQLDDLASYAGSGRIEADAYNLLDLPVFLNVVKALDVFSLFGGSRRSRIELDFDIADRALQFTSGIVKSRDLTMTVVPPGSLTFGGIVDTRLDVSHGNEMSIPLIGDLLNLPASLLLGGLEIQGPIEDPKVSSRSLGFGAPEGVPAAGRRPITKDPKIEDR